jgi:hypothetical protein
MKRRIEKLLTKATVRLVKVCAGLDIGDVEQITFDYVPNETGGRGNVIVAGSRYDMAVTFAIEKRDPESRIQNDD